MSEFSKFLRYIIPGLIFGVEYVLLIFYSNYTYYREFMGSDIKDIVNIGSVVVGFLAAGGIGFIFSAIHHVSFHIIRRINIPVLRIDHLKAIKAAENKNLILFERIEDDKITNVKADDLTQSGAWRILTYYWNSRLELSKIIKSSDPRTRTLADLLHATGTILIANVSAILAWWITIHYSEFEKAFWAGVPVVIFFFLIHFLNHIFVIRDSEGVINAIFLEELCSNKKRTKKETRFLVSKKDIKCRFFKNIKSF